MEIRRISFNSYRVMIMFPLIKTFFIVTTRSMEFLRLGLPITGVTSKLSKLLVKVYLFQPATFFQTGFWRLAPAGWRASYFEPMGISYVESFYWQKPQWNELKTLCLPSKHRQKSLVTVELYQGYHRSKDFRCAIKNIP
jgi:hypothetical protein